MIYGNYFEYNLNLDKASFIRI